jgi:hypothetical protein
MPIKTFVEDVTTLDESLQSFYKPLDSGEGYVLDAEPVNGFSVENVDNLKLTLGKERTQRKEFEKKATKLEKQFEGIDLDELNEIKSKYEKLAELDPETEAAKIAEERIKQAEDKVNAKITKKQQEWEKLHKQEVGSRDEKLNSLTSQLKELMIHSAAVEALSQAGAAKNIELLMPHVLSNTRLTDSEDGRLTVEVVDSEGYPRVRSDGHNMSIEDLMPEMATKWPHAFDVSVKSGGGTRDNGKPVTGRQSSEGKTSVDMIKEGLANLGR